MKKIIFIPLIGLGLALFTGCATSTQQNTKSLSFKSIDLLDKYGVSESALMKAENGYIFVIPAPNGADIYKLDKNYNLVWKKTTPILLDPIKSQVIGDKLYILGYDQKKNKVALLQYDLKGNLIKTSYYGKAYNLARDFAIINGKTYVAVTEYTPNNNSDIVIYSNDNKKITLSTPYMDDVKYIKPYKNGILIIGTTQSDSENVIIAYKTLDNKTVWAKIIDLGMDEKPIKVSIKNNEIILDILSTDNMGAEKDVTFIIDENGKVKSVKKGIEFKQLPMKYRT
ncbi:putative lipoprotein [Nautilia profundicola AmH]|uniref:Lipoprotein n=1 Tax=Nautilia profundicola (strain ATCC BAA-1463 / DSM 18972 / AmH) TaxID=598659 RepID=B9L8E3_NAUPA|nr:hypothetical protein [Nautilia profundicola]ACM92164.1 putative lipoprotein [Nautilia profundicola AmH]